ISIGDKSPFCDIEKKFNTTYFDIRGGFFFEIYVKGDLFRQ
ncbi:hypothetical protein LCGC14_2117760, partial [marine sediment metagenome]